MTVQALIVTANDDLALLLSTIARINQYQARACARTDAALAALAYDSIGLILLDTPCPDIGFEQFVYQLRARQCSAPIVLLSTNDDLRFAVDLLSLDGFLCKPFDIGEIVAWLRLLDQPQERAVGW